MKNITKREFGMSNLTLMVGFVIMVSNGHAGPGHHDKGAVSIERQHNAKSTEAVKAPCHASRDNISGESELSPRVIRNFYAENTER